jgi:hypothetical protein
MQQQGARSPRIMIIRHSEKPGKPGPPFGVDHAGNPDPESLAPRGWQRAGALAVFFAPARGELQDEAISVPQYLFACGNEPERARLRPLETITPLAEVLGTAVDTRFIKGEEAELAACAMDCPGPVLISWEHNNLPAIANSIVGNQQTAPKKWPEDRFDVVWVFDLVDGSYSFRQIPQLLLAGDRADVI